MDRGVHLAVFTTFGFGQLPVFEVSPSGGWRAVTRHVVDTARHSPCGAVDLGARWHQHRMARWAPIRVRPGWLHANRYEPDAARPPTQRTLWRCELAADLPEIEFDEVMSDDDGLRRYLGQLVEFGVSFVRHAPTVDGTVAALAERIAFIRNSNFGPVWDVISKPDPDSLAYTSHTLTPHTDLVARQMMPGVQFLHCMVFEATGGDSTLV